MSDQKLIVPGFGLGSALGTPTTVALDSTSTVSLANTTTSTVVPSGSYMVTGLVAGTSLQAKSTANGVTGTWSVLSGAPGMFWNDGSSCQLVSTTTSVSIVFIQV